MYRSHRLDIADDLSGKSCGPLTLRRLDWLQQAVTEHFAELADNLGPDEAGLSQAALLSRLEGLREEIGPTCCRYRPWWVREDRT